MSRLISKILLPNDLELRIPTPADLPALKNAVQESLPQLKGFMKWAHFEDVVESQRNRILGIQKNFYAQDDFTYCLFAANGELMVSSGLHEANRFDKKAREVGYWSNTKYAGQGWATYVTKIMIVLAVEHYQCPRVVIGCDELNGGSRKVIEKCGFIYEGRFRKELPTCQSPDFKGGGDALKYALLPEEAKALPWYSETLKMMRVYDEFDGWLA